MKILLVEPTVQTTWVSCLSIMPNLVESYEQWVGRPLPKIDYGRHSTSVSTLKAANEILVADPEILVFVDHLQHPLPLLRAIDFVYGRKAWPKLVFHVYGDFTLNTHAWRESEDLLAGQFVRFVTASPRQKEMISRFVKNDAELVSVCPFPVSSREYGFVDGLRSQERAARGYAADEFVMTYTGRLSLQKNIIKMIWEVARAAEGLDRPWRLQLAGAFDDLGSPFFSLRMAPGSYFEGVARLLESLPESVRSKIEFLGSLDKRQLRSLYHASDLFVSFSTHHDEDYGMSPIEALCCGCPALVSDWGGFQGFGLDGESVSFLPVSLTGSGPRLHVDQLPKLLLRFVSRREDEARRQTRSKFYLAGFGVGAASSILAALPSSMRSRFVGFKPTLRKHAKLISHFHADRGLFKTGRRVDPNYREFYEPYLAPERRRR